MDNSERQNQELVINSWARKQHNIMREFTLLGFNIFVLFIVDSYMSSLYEHGRSCYGIDILDLIPYLFIFCFYSNVYQLDRSLKLKNEFFAVTSTLILLNWSLLLFIYFGNIFSHLRISEYYYILFLIFALIFSFEGFFYFAFMCIAFFIHRRYFQCYYLELRFSWSRIGISVLIGFLLFVLLYPYRGT
jgi:hypothetical protein